MSNDDNGQNCIEPHVCIGNTNGLIQTPSVLGFPGVQRGFIQFYFESGGPGKRPGGKIEMGMGRKESGANEKRE